MSTETSQPLKEFSQFHLDFRLVRAIAKMGINNPTEIQNQVIPLALKGKDILARAKTGSGKTLAYGAPIIQSILSKMDNASGNATDKGIQALILVPTSELSFQVADHLTKLTLYAPEVKIVNVISKNQLENKQANVNQLDPAIKSQLKEIPHIVIGTPNKILELINTKAIDIKTSLTHLAIDEADLILSFGYFDDLKSLVPNLPNPCQTYLMSATLPPDLKELNSLILTNPAIVHLKDSDDRGQLTEYQFPCNGEDKYLLLYVILKLKLIKGRCIIFVNLVDRAYQIKLFLEKFGIKTCILNSELPLNSRYHIIQEFNRGKYDYIIATDEYKPAQVTEVKEEEAETKEEEGENVEASKDDDEVEVKEEDKDDEFPNESDDEEEAAKEETTEETKDSKPKKKKQKKQKKKQQYDAVTGTYGVSRGVDFQNVAAVINFDFPPSVENYTHRVGRTARGGKKGMSLSLIENDDPEELILASQVEQSREKLGAKVQPFKFDLSQIEGFRYRAHDAMRSVTKTHVKEARLTELKEQILNSDKLQTHFEDRPQDLEFLRHDLPLLPKSVQSHLKHVPQYLLPKIQEVTSEGASLGKRHADDTSLGPIQFNSKHHKKYKQNKGKNKKLDPLKNFAKKMNNKRARK